LLSAASKVFSPSIPKLPKLLQLAKASFASSKTVVFVFTSLIKLLSGEAYLLHHHEPAYTSFSGYRKLITIAISFI
jgi:hypothetical protein